MPSSLLFGVNTEGRVFGLSTNGTKWREFVYLGLEFKQLSAIPHSLWAVGGDRQIYVHVHGLDIPIRIKEEAYENERWTPVHGFSNRLLPTDRFNFSSQDGKKDRTLKKVRLPSMAWQWEGDWHLELTLEGQPLDHDGWTYAVDFPATYHPTKQWTSCVRRRKWIRYRRYSAMNSWCAISPLHKDATQEPFIGVSAGGHEGGFDGGRIAVWAVTANGRVMFRTEVSASSPEGQRWSAVPLPPGCDVMQLSVGASGLLWACLQNGKALVRSGVTRDCIIGTGWIEVPPPLENLPLQQISVGTNTVWAISRDHRVWFRSGVRAELAGVSEDLAKGAAWVEMIGRLASVSVTVDEQVFAIGALDRLLYFRTGVNEDNLTGKTWRQVGAPTQLSRTGSVASLFSVGSVPSRERRHRSWTSLNRHSGSHETGRLEFDLDGACHSAPAFSRPMPCGVSNSLGAAHSSSSSSGIPSSLPEEPEFRVPEIHEAKPRITEPNDMYEDTSHPVVGFPVTKEHRVTKSTRAWSPLHSVGSVVAIEAHSEADSSVFDSETLTGVYGEVGEREEEDDYLYWTDSEAFWSFVEAGACLIHPGHPPNWFAEPPNSGKAELERPWRLKILEELRLRLPEGLLNGHEYEVAVDTSSWVKTADVRYQADTTWQDAVLSLEWVAGGDGADCGTLTVTCPVTATVYTQCSVAELSAIFNCSEPGSPRLSLHRGEITSTIKLSFAGEDDLEEWMAELNELSCLVRSLPVTPGPDTLWLTSTLGDVHAFDSAYLAAEQRDERSSNHVVEISTVGQNTPICLPLYSGFPPGASVVIVGCAPDGAARFSVNLACGGEEGDLAFHCNPRFTDDCVVRNARRAGVWGPEDRRGVQPFTRGKMFTLEIICDVASFRVKVNDQHFTEFAVRGTVEEDNALGPAAITHLTLHGDIVSTKVTYSAPILVLHPPAMFFRHIGGHLRKVVSAGGVTWGIGHDNTAWVYVGGTGGPFLKGTDLSKNQPMMDGYTYYVYENQRWNPLTGYTSHGLPTDRHMWSDVTGRHKRTREKTKLLSRRWQWEGDWAIDFSTPGGVDKDGWQYAVDFPANYHGVKHLTDYVRRRRWRRRARLVTSGPWRELGHTSLADCCLHVDDDGQVTGWGAALNGDVLFRRGITADCPPGVAWEHIPCDQPMLTLSSAPNQLWGVSRSGCAFWRYEVTSHNPLGLSWETVDSPRNASLKMISVGASGVWALDTLGRLSVRNEVSRIFPSGSSWRTLPLQHIATGGEVEGDAALPTSPLAVPTSGFRQISVGKYVWAVTGSGWLVYRLNVTSDNAIGTTWVSCIDANCCHASAW